MWCSTLMPSSSFSVQKKVSAFLSMSSRVKSGIFARISGVDGVSWYSFNSLVALTSFSSSSSERDAL